MKNESDNGSVKRLARRVKRGRQKPSRPRAARGSQGVPGAWREADDLIIMVLPGDIELTMTNGAAERLYYDFARIVGIRNPIPPAHSASGALSTGGEAHPK
jgi:hypothetical protein